MTLAQPHVHGADTVQALVDAGGNVVDPFTPQVHEPYALELVRGNLVLQQRGGQPARQGVRQHLAVLVLDHDVGDQLLALVQPALVENEAQELGDVVVQDIASPALGDGMGDGRAPLLQFVGQGGDQNPTGDEGDGGGDEQDAHQHGQRQLVFEGGPFEPPPRLLDEAHEPSPPAPGSRPFQSSRGSILPPRNRVK